MNENVSNKTILVTRAKAETDNALNALREAGFRLLFFPTIETVYCEPENSSNFNGFNFDYVVFPSAKAVKFFSQFLETKGLKFDFEKTIIAATGSKTAERCAENGIEVDIIPAKFSAEGLLEYFSSLDINGKKILIPSSKIAREELSEGLKTLGADVTQLTVYDTVKANPDAETLDRLKERTPDIFVFTSPSSFERFLEIAEIKNAKEYFSGKEIFAIGKTTANAIELSGGAGVKYPEEFTLKGIAELILKSPSLEKEGFGVDS